MTLAKKLLTALPLGLLALVSLHIQALPVSASSPNIGSALGKQSSAWDSYIDNLVAQSQDATDFAAIIGLDGSSWTSDEHPNALVLSDEEATTIAEVMALGDYTTFEESGIIVGGVEYQFLRGEERIVFGKKKDLGAITIRRSDTAVVIAHTKEGASQENTNDAVDALADYLEAFGM